MHGPNVRSISGAWITPDLTHIDVRKLSDPASVTLGYSNPRLAVSSSRTLVAWRATQGTFYRVIDGIPPVGRQHAVGGGIAESLIPGALLIDATHDNRGRLVVLTERAIPTVQPYLGLYPTTIGDDGKGQPTSFLFAFEPGEQVMGKVIVRGGDYWIIETFFPSLFEPAAAARRLYIRETASQN